jgi:hypothetical protein
MIVPCSAGKSLEAVAKPEHVAGVVQGADRVCCFLPTEGLGRMQA